MYSLINMVFMNIISQGEIWGTWISVYNTCKMHIKFEDGYKQRTQNISDNELNTF